MERFLGDVLHMDLYSYGTEPSVSQTLWKHVGTVTQCLVIDTLIHLSLRILHMVSHLSPFLTERLSRIHVSNPYDKSNDPRFF